MKWFLIVTIMQCNGSGIDPCFTGWTTKELRVAMPTIEVCRQVRVVNIDSKCIGVEVD